MIDTGQFEELLTEIDKKMDEMADNIFANSQTQIVQKNIIDEGTLLKSGSMNKGFLEKTITYSAIHAQSTEYGRLPGSMPPVNALKGWVKRKGIASKQKDIDRIAWAVSKNIKEEGLQPRPYLGPAVEMEKQRLRSN